MFDMSCGAYLEIQDRNRGRASQSTLVATVPFWYYPGVPIHCFEHAPVLGGIPVRGSSLRRRVNRARASAVFQRPSWLSRAGLTARARAA